VLLLGIDVKSSHFSEVFDLVVEERFQKLAGNSVPHRIESCTILEAAWKLLLKNGTIVDLSRAPVVGYKCLINSRLKDILRVLLTKTFPERSRASLAKVEEKQKWIARKS
jgi:hypothetical protein